MIPMIPPEQMKAIHARTAERRAELETLVLEIIAELISEPITPLRLDKCATDIVEVFNDLTSAEQRGLRFRLGEVRRLARPSMVRGRT